jgi:hypothetical protein
VDKENCFEGAEETIISRNVSSEAYAIIYPSTRRSIAGTISATKPRSAFPDSAFRAIPPSVIW